MIWKYKVGSFLRRNNFAIAFAIIAVALGTILFFQSIATSRLQEQVEGQQHIIEQVKAVADKIDSSSQQRTQQIQSINDHLDCIVQFFSQSERDSKAIANIETCQVKAAATKTTPDVIQQQIQTIVVPKAPIKTNNNKQ